MSKLTKTESARINGAKSRGPKTEEGKARSRFNALRHGLAARTVCLTERERPIFEAMVAAYNERFRPADTVEEDLIEQMCVAKWRQRRCWSMETAALNVQVRRDRRIVDQEFVERSVNQLSARLQIAKLDDMTRNTIAFMSLAEKSDFLRVLGRYESSACRAYFSRSYARLVRLRKLAAVGRGSALPKVTSRFCRMTDMALHRRLRLNPWVGYPLAVLSGLLIYAASVLAPVVTAKLRGRAPDCPWSSLLAVPYERVVFVRMQHEIELQMRKEASDDRFGIVKLHMPDRSFWIPRAGKELDGPHLLSFLYVDHQTMTPSRTEHVEKGDIVLDVGAHVGVFTHFALKYGAAKVVMLEPDPINIECLKRNFPEEISSGRVVLLPEGAWDATSTMRLSSGEANSGTGSLIWSQAGSRFVDVRVRPIDAIVAELGLRRVDMIKMDIEGAERNALKGAESVLRRWKPRILLDMYHRPDDIVVLPAIIRKGNPNYQAACQSCEYYPGEAVSAYPHVTLFY